MQNNGLTTPQVAAPVGLFQNVCFGRQGVRTVFLFSFLSILGACAYTPQTQNKPLPETASVTDSQLAAASKVLAGGNDGNIVEYFNSMPTDPRSMTLEPGKLFLLGRAYFNTVVNEIKLSRGGDPPGMGLLTERSVSMLVVARDNLIAAGDGEPEGDFAPEAYYLAARSMDHGYLQDFPKAMELYKWAAKTYPGSEFGQKAADRYLDLRDRFGIK